MEHGIANPELSRVIAVLPAHVVDQIAAGEVIERPASVVKELVDNAIDARAKTIAIEAAAGGRGLVRVTDDGCGMSAEDAVIAFERHATSKLRHVDDLWGIATMGFRGEALPSIASVGKVVLTTRRVGDLAGTRVVVEGGKLVSVSEVGAPVGTTVEVADLLYNVPARLKFLKGDATEASHITELVARFAMAHPLLHFRLRHRSGEGVRTVLELPPDRDGLARAQALLGPRVATRLVAGTVEHEGIHATVYLGAPELAQTTARGVQIYVGRRAVRDRGVLHALTMGYGELIPRGRHPVAIALLELPAGAVDVNVHPQKSEVRFADAGVVATAVRRAVQAAVATAPWRDEAAGPMQMTAIASSSPPPLPFDGPATPLAERYARELERPLRSGLRAQPSLGFGGGPAGVSASAGARAWSTDVRKSTARGRAIEQRAVAAYEQRLRDELAAQEQAAPPRLADGSGPTPQGYFAQLRYLGQLDLTYLVCESAGELVLVDQHVAHERVELARLEARARSEGPAVQKLLFPLTTEVTPAQLAIAVAAADVLAKIGYDVEPFGKATLAVKAVPAGIRHGDPAQLLCALLDEWHAAGAPSDAERMTRVLAEIACRSVVRAGDRLGPSEAEALLRALDEVDLAAPAPHGRALLLRMPLAEIGRRFGR